MQEKTVEVPGISCGHCKHTIETEVRELPGVTSVAVDLEHKRARIAWQESETGWPAIRELLAEIGYPAQEQ